MEKQLCLTVAEVIVIKKMIEAKIRNNEQIYQDETDLGAKIQQFINELEGDF